VRNSSDIVTLNFRNCRFNPPRQCHNSTITNSP